MGSGVGVCCGGFPPGPYGPLHQQLVDAGKRGIIDLSAIEALAAEVAAESAPPKGAVAFLHAFWKVVPHDVGQERPGVLEAFDLCSAALLSPDAPQKDALTEACSTAMLEKLLKAAGPASPPAPPLPPSDTEEGEGEDKGKPSSKSTCTSVRLTVLCEAMQLWSEVGEEGRTAKLKEAVSRRLDSESLPVHGNVSLDLATWVKLLESFPGDERGCAMVVRSAYADGTLPNAVAAFAALAHDGTRFIDLVSVLINMFGFEWSATLQADIFTKLESLPDAQKTANNIEVDGAHKLTHELLEACFASTLKLAREGKLGVLLDIIGCLQATAVEAVKSSPDDAARAEGAAGPHDEALSSPASGDPSAEDSPGGGEAKDSGKPEPRTETEVASSALAQRLVSGEACAWQLVRMAVQAALARKPTLIPQRLQAFGLRYVLPLAMDAIAEGPQSHVELPAGKKKDDLTAAILAEAAALRPAARSLVQEMCKEVGEEPAEISAVVAPVLRRQVGRDAWQLKPLLSTLLGISEEKAAEMTRQHADTSSSDEEDEIPRRKPAEPKETVDTTIAAAPLEGNVASAPPEPLAGPRGSMNFEESDDDDEDDEEGGGGPLAHSLRPLAHAVAPPQQHPCRQPSCQQQPLPGLRQAVAEDSDATPRPTDGRAAPEELLQRLRGELLQIFQFCGGVLGKQGMEIEDLVEACAAEPGIADFFGFPEEMQEGDEAWAAMLHLFNHIKTDAAGRVPFQNFDEFFFTYVAPYLHMDDDEHSPTSTARSGAEPPEEPPEDVTPLRRLAGSSEVPAAAAKGLSATSEAMLEEMEDESEDEDEDENPNARTASAGALHSQCPQPPSSPNEAPDLPQARVGIGAATAEVSAAALQQQGPTETLLPTDWAPGPNPVLARERLASTMESTKLESIESCSMSPSLPGLEAERLPPKTLASTRMSSAASDGLQRLAEAGPVPALQRHPPLDQSHGSLGLPLPSVESCEPRTASMREASLSGREPSQRSTTQQELLQAMAGMELRPPPSAGSVTREETLSSDLQRQVALRPPTSAGSLMREETFPCAHGAEGQVLCGQASAEPLAEALSCRQAERGIRDGTRTCEEVVLQSYFQAKSSSRLAPSTQPPPVERYREHLETSAPAAEATKRDDGDRETREVTRRYADAAASARSSRGGQTREVTRRFAEACTQAELSPSDARGSKAVPVGVQTTSRLSNSGGAAPGPTDLHMEQLGETTCSRPRSLRGTELPRSPKPDEQLERLQAHVHALQTRTRELESENLQLVMHLSSLQSLENPLAVSQAGGCAPRVGAHPAAAPVQAPTMQSTVQPPWAGEQCHQFDQSQMMSQCVPIPSASVAPQVAKEASQPTAPARAAETSLTGSLFGAGPLVNISFGGNTSHMPPWLGDMQPSPSHPGRPFNPYLEAGMQFAKQPLLAGPDLAAPVKQHQLMEASPTRTPARGPGLAEEVSSVLSNVLGEEMKGMATELRSVSRTLAGELRSACENMQEVHQSIRRQASMPRLPATAWAPVGQDISASFGKPDLGAWSSMSASFSQQHLPRDAPWQPPVPRGQFVQPLNSSSLSNSWWPQCGSAAFEPAATGKCNLGSGPPSAATWPMEHLSVGRHGMAPKVSEEAWSSMPLPRALGQGSAYGRKSVAGMVSQPSEQSRCPPPLPSRKQLFSRQLGDLDARLQGLDARFRSIGGP